MARRLSERMETEGEILRRVDRLAKIVESWNASVVSLKRKRGSNVRTVKIAI